MVAGRAKPVACGHEEQHGLEAAGVVARVALVTEQDPLGLFCAAAPLAEAVVFF